MEATIEKITHIKCFRQLAQALASELRDMQIKKIGLFLLFWLTSTSQAGFIVSKLTEEEFVRSRDIIVIGELTDIAPIDEVRKDGAKLAIYTVTVYHTLRNKKNKKEAKSLGEIKFKAPSYENEMMLSSWTMFEEGSEGVWLFNSRKENYGVPEPGHGILYPFDQLPRLMKILKK